VLLASTDPSGAPDLLGASLCMTTDATSEVRFDAETQQLEFKLSDAEGGVQSVVVTLAATVAAAGDGRPAAAAEWSQRARMVAVRFQEYWQYECMVSRGEAPPASQCAAAALTQHFSAAAGSRSLEDELCMAGGARAESHMLDNGSGISDEEDEAHHVARLSRCKEVLQVADSISRMLNSVNSTLTTRAGMSRREHKRRVLEAHLQALTKSVEAQVAAEAEAAARDSSAPRLVQASPPSEVASEAMQSPSAGVEGTQVGSHGCAGGDTPVDGTGQWAASGLRVAAVAPAVATGAGLAHGRAGAPPQSTSPKSYGGEASTVVISSGGPSAARIGASQPFASGEQRFVFPIAFRPGSKLVAPPPPPPPPASSGANATSRSAQLRSSSRGRGGGAVAAPGRWGDADSPGSGGRSHHPSSGGAFAIDNFFGGAGAGAVDQMPSSAHLQQRLQWQQQQQQLVQLQQQLQLQLLQASLASPYAGGGASPAGMEGMYAAALQQQAAASAATTAPGHLGALFGASISNDMLWRGQPMQPPLPGLSSRGAAAGAGAPSPRPDGSLR